MTAHRDDEPDKPRRPIKFSPRVRVGITVGALVIGGLVVWGTLPGDDDDDRDDDRQTEQVQHSDDDGD